MKVTSKKYLLSAILIAMAVVLGYAFMFIPNVEVFTATVFIAGFLVGPVYGFLVGIIAEFIFSFFNPLGAPMPFILAAQVLSMGVAGLAGGLLRNGRWIGLKPLGRILYFGSVGFLITLFFDVLTTLSFSVFMVGLDASKLLATFLPGILFYITHIVVNTIIFSTLVPFILKRLHQEVYSEIRSL